MAGAPLSQSMFIDAQRVGVAEPQRVRILYVPEIPIPQHPALRAAAEQTQLISPLTGGLTLRYGIFIRADCAYSRAMLVMMSSSVSKPLFLGAYCIEL